MTVKQAIEVLQTMPQDQQLVMDYEEILYPIEAICALEAQPFSFWDDPWIGTPPTPWRADPCVAVFLTKRAADAEIANRARKRAPDGTHHE